MPIRVVCGTCQAEYTLKDDLAGRKVRCQECESILVVPDLAPEESRPAIDRGYDPAFNRDRFFVNQKKLSINEKYYVFDEDKQPILFIERPAHLGRSCLAALGIVGALLLGFLALALIGMAVEQEAISKAVTAVAVLGVLIGTAVLTVYVAILLVPKRHITVYADESKERPLLEIFQDQKFQFLRATYTVNDPVEGPLGVFWKNYLYNLIRKRWYIMDNEGQVRFLAKEDSVILSLLRRLLGPFFGLLRTNFIVVEPNAERVIGEFNRKFTLFDRYVLDMSADRDHALDRRLAVALAVLLDTGERR